MTYTGITPARPEIVYHLAEQTGQAWENLTDDDREDLSGLLVTGLESGMGAHEAAAIAVETWDNS